MEASASSAAGAHLRPMEQEDVAAVLALIEAHDEDDAEEAGETYAERGLLNQKVLVRGGEVVGVTGYVLGRDTDGSAWLSWTYVREDCCGQGLGRHMVTAMVEELRGQELRKLFVSASDYKEDGEDLYLAARKLYQSVGFRQELMHRDYYHPGENHYIYGLRLKPRDVRPTGPWTGEELVIEDIFPIPETDGAYSVAWKLRRPWFGRPAPLKARQLEAIKRKARDARARCVFIALPAAIPGFAPALLQAGFAEAGRLEDYVADGVDEVQFRFNV